MDRWQQEKQAGKPHQGAPVARDHPWQKSTAGGAIVENTKDGGRIAKHPSSGEFGATYDPKNPDAFRKSELGTEPLCTIEQLQDILLVKVRTRGKDADGENMIPRTVPRVERLPKQEITPKRFLCYLEELERCGQQREACTRAGLGYNDICKLKNRVPELKELAMEAVGRFVEGVEMEAHRRAVEGVLEPVFGGQFKDKVVGHVRKYSDKLMEIILKRHNPAFREKFEGEIRVTGGVMVVPTQSLSLESWSAQHSGEKQTVAERDAIEGEVVGRGASGQQPQLGP